MFANKMFLMAEFIHIYANPLSTLAVGMLASTTVVWQTDKGVHKLEWKIAGTEEKLESKIELLRVDVQDLRGEV
jgi:hypothetical protein